MTITEKLDRWAYAHHPRWIDFLRIVLGIILVLKGFFFIRDTESLIELMKNSRFEWVSFIVAHYVAFAHLFGGFMITIGLLTRVAVMFQLPILIGAVLFINHDGGFFTVNAEWPFSFLVLILLTFFFIYGSGPASADQALVNERREEKG